MLPSSSTILSVTEKLHLESNFFLKYSNEKSISIKNVTAIDVKGDPQKFVACSHSAWIYNSYNEPSGDPESWQKMHQSSVSSFISDVVKKSVWNLLNKCINSAEGVYAALED